MGWVGLGWVEETGPTDISVVTWSDDTVAMVTVLQEFDDTFQSVHQPTVSPVTQLFQSSAHHGHGRLTVT